jgi:cytochrome bd ubiquinol oxidase subunit II
MSSRRAWHTKQPRGVAVGAVVLVPSLSLLYTLVLRGRLDTDPETPESPETVAAAASLAASPAARRTSRGSSGSRGSRGWLVAPFTVVTLVVGVGLLVFADPAWAHGLGAVCLLACAVTVFALVADPPEQGQTACTGRHRPRD